MNNSFSFAQCFVDGNVQRVRMHLRRLKELGFARFGVPVSIHRLRTLELRGESFSTTPTRHDPRVALVLAAPDGLDDFDNLHRRIAAPIRERFDQPTLRAADRQLVASFRSPSEEEKRLRAILKEHIADCALNLVQFGSTLMEGNLFVEDDRLSEIRARPNRFKVHVLLAAMITLHQVGCYLNDAHTPIHPWLKRENDNWNDMHVAGSAAYADILVTDDANMRGRLAFLADRGFAFVRAVSLDAFLTGLPDRK